MSLGGMIEKPLDDGSSQTKTRDITFIEPVADYVLPNDVYWLMTEPYSDSNIYNRQTTPNIALKILDHVVSEDGQWYYVETVALDTPSNVKGWISIENTTQITQENIKDIYGPVGVLKGTVVADEENDKIVLEMDYQGIIVKSDSDRVYIDVAGGLSFWVNKEDVIYPEL